MFNSFIFKIARRYFFARSSKTIVNRINRFAFIMIVVSACSLIVLSAFSGVKTLAWCTNSFDPDLRLPKVGKYFVLKLGFRKGLYSLCVLHLSCFRGKVLLSNPINSAAIILKGFDSNHFLNKQLNSLSLVGAYDGRDTESIYLASIASDLDVVLSELFCKRYTSFTAGLSLLNPSPFKPVF